MQTSVSFSVHMGNAKKSLCSPDELMLQLLNIDAEAFWHVHMGSIRALLAGEPLKQHHWVMHPVQCFIES